MSRAMHKPLFHATCRRAYSLSANWTWKYLLSFCCRQSSMPVSYHHYWRSLLSYIVRKFVPGRPSTFFWGGGKSSASLGNSALTKARRGFPKRWQQAMRHTSMDSGCAVRSPVVCAGGVAAQFLWRSALAAQQFVGLGCFNLPYLNQPRLRVCVAVASTAGVGPPLSKRTASRNSDAASGLVFSLNPLSFRG